MSRPRALVFAAKTRVLDDVAGVEFQRAWEPPSNRVAVRGADGISLVLGALSSWIGLCSARG